MDINQCIDHLGLNRNTYRLDKNDSPHVIVSWGGPDTQPTQEELEAAWTQIQTASDNDYVSKRKAEYPTIEECVHAILDDALVALQEKRTAVKIKYPK